MTAPSQASSGSFRQTAVGLLALAALWNAVYWLWPVHRQAPVVMASANDAGANGPESKPEAPSLIEPMSETTVPEALPLPEPVTMIMGGGQPSHSGIIDPIVFDPDSKLSIVPPRFTLYTTTTNDRNLGDIASRFYGDKSLAGVIAQANPFKDPARLKAGQVWRVPVDPENIQGQPVDGEGKPIDSAIPSPPPAEYSEYVVQAKDTLGAISQLHYNTTRHADAIYAFNKDRLGLRSPRSIKPGQVLRIPKEPK